MSTISLQQEDKVAFLTIDRVTKHNALNQAMWEQIAEFCDELENHLKPRVLIVSGSGEKAFSTGADIQELQQIILNENRLLENNRLVQLAQQKLENLTCATIASINGLCFGGGVGIALACDFRLAAANAQFAITPSKLGLVYSIEDTRRLLNAVGLAKAKELLYLGKRIDAQQALQCGLVNEVVEPGSLQSKTTEMAESILAVSGYSVSGIKRTLHHIAKTDESAEKEIRALFNEAFGQVDFAEGAKAFLEKRAADFK